MADNSLYNEQHLPKTTDILLYFKDVEEFNDLSDTDILGFLNKRWFDMDRARPNNDWATRWKQFEAMTYWNDDGTAETNLPIEFATIRNKMADALSRQPIIKLVPTEKEDVDKVDFMKQIWNYVWTEADTDKELFHLFAMAYIFGTGFWYEGMHTELKTFYEPKVNKDGLVTSTPKTVKLSWLKGYALDIRDVYVDPVHDIEQAVDCFLIEREVSRDRLDNLRNDPNYFNIDEALKSNGSHDRMPKKFISDEEILRMHDYTHNKYILFHYYNKEKGIYCVSVNNEVLIRKGASPFAHGELPISLLYDHLAPRQLYGRGECELLESTKYERNEIRNQIIDMARRSNDIKLALGRNVSLENIGWVDSTTQVMNFDGDMSQFQYLKPVSQDSMLMNIEELLSKDATWITGIDNNALMGEPTKTAFEARLQEQQKLKGVNVSLKLADYFYTRMGRQRLVNIQTWMPITTGKKIIGNSKFRTIALSDVEKTPIKRFKNGEITETGAKFSTKHGNVEFLELKPSIVRCSLDITIETPSTTPVLKELDRQDLANILQEVLQIAQVKPDLLQTFDFEKYLRERMMYIGLDYDEFFKGTNSFNDKKNLRQSVLGDLPMPFQPKNQPNRVPMYSIIQQLQNSLRGQGQQGQPPQGQPQQQPMPQQMPMQQPQPQMQIPTNR